MKSGLDAKPLFLQVDMLMEKSCPEYVVCTWSRFLKSELGWEYSIDSVY